MDARWTIEELNERALKALDLDEEQLGLRTLRYYSALGLLDRPAAMRGRKAFYGERHLLQLVAIKRLQADGLSLESVQARMTAMPTSTLRAIAKVPDKLLEGKQIDVPSRDDEEFWTHDAQPERRAVVQAVQIDPAVTICIATNHPLQTSDIDAVHDAAQHLLRVLAARGLIARSGV